MLRVRILDLDGSLVPQREVFANEAYEWISGGDWGPRIRLACTFPGVPQVSHLARRLTHRTKSRDHLLRFGRFPPRHAGPARANPGSVQPPGPGQTSGLDAGDTLPPLRDLAPSRPPPAEPEPGVPLRWRDRLRQRLPRTRPLGRPGLWPSRRSSLPSASSDAAAGRVSRRIRSRLTPVSLKKPSRGSSIRSARSSAACRFMYRLTRTS